MLKSSNFVLEMKKILIPFLLLTGLLFSSSSYSSGIGLSNSEGLVSADSARSFTVECAHFFNKSQPSKRLISLVSELIDIEEEEDFFEGHSSAKKELRPHQSFKSSAAFYFGYLSQHLAFQAKLNFYSRAKYLVQQVFRL